MAASRRNLLLRHGDYARLWTAATISLFGTQVSLVAIPVIAVFLLHAKPFEVALLGTLEFLPFLLFALPAGVWVDRLPRRLILVTGDLGRALSLVSIPIAHQLGVLSIWQLYAVGFVNGCLTVFFDVADQSFLPAILDSDDLVEGNSKLQVSSSAAQILGQPLAGGVVGLLTAPLAVLLDALSFLVSGGLISTIRKREPARRSTSKVATARQAEGSSAAMSADASQAASSSAPLSAPLAANTSNADDPPAPVASMRREIGEGLRYVLGHRYLRYIAACTGLSNLFSNMAFAIFPIYAYRVLVLTPPEVGLIGGLGSLGFLFGALVTGRISRRFGVGRSIVGSAILSGPGILLAAAAQPGTALAILVASGFITGFSAVVYNINQVTLRQAITPERMQGRMNATMRFIVWGTIPIGSIVGGVLGTVVGVREAVIIGGIGACFAFVPLLFSPVKSLERMPTGAGPGEGDGSTTGGRTIVEAEADAASPGSANP